MGDGCWGTYLFEQQHSTTFFDSVVIKVGMVGDSQIGKTSLMVKYVEGSFDEDYIQTLGMSHLASSSRGLTPAQALTLWRKQYRYGGQLSHFLYGIWEVRFYYIHVRVNPCLPSVFAGQREFVNMLPLVCNDAVAILFMFDLTRKSTLNSVKEWYRQARGFNKASRSASFALLIVTG